MSSRVNSGGGSPRNGCSRSSGGHQGIPSCAYRDSSSVAGGNSPRPATYACDPVPITSSVPKRAGSATTSSTGTPSTVTPTARRSLRSSTDTIAGSCLECVEHPPRPSRRGHHREVERSIGPAARVAGNLAVNSRSDLFEHLARPIQSQALRGLRLPFAFERGEEALLRLRSDPRNRCQPPFPRRHPELLGGGDAERFSDLDHPLRADAEKAAKPDEFGLHLAFELVELREVTGLDELAQARRDSRADPSQLLDAPCGNELGDRRLRLADRLRRSPIRARCVEPRAGEIEECGETLQPLSDRCVVEGVRHGLVSLAP